MDVDALSSSSPVASQAVTAEAPRPVSSFSTSRRSSGRGTPSSFAPSTPPPLPEGDYLLKAEDDDGGDDEEPSVLDPRRLTPNLHANLVSEILSLRRDIESKDSTIDRLEGSLAGAKSENESLEVQLAKKSKETRAIKRQLQSIEDGTLSALEELCKERDDASDLAADLKRRLDASQKQLKAQQDEHAHFQKLWNEEKLALEHDKRQLKRKNEVAEGRLKAVVDELVATQPNGDATEVDTSSAIRDFASNNDGSSSLPASPTKTRSHLRNRSSVSTIGSVQRDSITTKGATLADELDADAHDAASEGDIQDDVGELMPETESQRGIDFYENGNERNLSHLSDINESDEGTADGPSDVTPIAMVSAAGSDEPANTTPAIERLSTSSSLRIAQGTTNFHHLESQFKANETSNQVPVARTIGYHARAQSEPVAGLKSAAVPSVLDMVRQLSNSAHSTSPPSEERVDIRTESISASTQTEPKTIEASTPRSSPAQMPPEIPVSIPQITIHPPENGPSSPGETVLPPQTRSTSTQTTTELPKIFRSIAVQTDIIRVDMRRFTLPPHLLPSALNNAPKPSRDLPSQPSSAKGRGESNSRAPSLLPSPTELDEPDLEHSDNLADLEHSEPSAAEDYRNRIMKNPLSNTRQTKVGESDPFEVSDDTWINEAENIPPAPSARSMKRPQKPAKPFDPPTPVPENEKVVISRHSTATARSSLERSNSNIRANNYGAASKGKHGRGLSDRSGSPSSRASSSAWSRSTAPPPSVVIPQRTSSVAIRHSKLDRGLSPNSRGSGSPTRGPNTRRIGKPPMLRKIRSASGISSEGRSDPGRGLPLSPFSQASFASGETSPAPVPENSVLQIYHAGHQRSSSSQTRRLSGFHPTGNASVGASVQHSVVDAIAATMVGEWMWKYMRRRKSFGVTDSSPDAAKSSEQRHKRWVWLSPYERCIMWSTKQPTSNSALMGKSGRKLVIQSVLDIKDDKSVSKNAPHGVFNRSILVLTPARAVKFTATSRERHYLWLTALSFLAYHTSGGNLDLSFLPLSTTATPNPEVDPIVSNTTSATASRSGRKPWSSRTTNRSQQSSGYVTPSVAEVPPSVDGAVNAVPPKPNRPAPQVPQPENFPTDAALPPNIPRVPNSRNANTYFGLPTKHGRKRSASITGVMSLSSRPSSRRLQATGTTANRSYPNTTNNSSNHSTKSGINDPASTTARSAAGTAAPPPAVPAVPSSSSNIAAKYFSSSSARQPTTPVRDDADVEAALTIPVPSFGRDFGWAPGADVEGDASTEFGGNNSFFDAVGNDMGPTGLGANGRRADAFSGPGFERPAQPKRPPPPPPGSAGSADPSQRHTPSGSIDSVAPPPIRFRGVQSPEPPVPAVPQQYRQQEEAAVTAEKSSVKKTYNPPQRRLPRWGLGKNSAAKKEAKSAAPNVSSVVAVVTDGEDKENVKAI